MLVKSVRTVFRDLYLEKTPIYIGYWAYFIRLAKGVVKILCCNLILLSAWAKSWSYPRDQALPQISIIGAVLQSVDKFSYLESTLDNTNSMKSELDIRIGKAAM